MLGIGKLAKQVFGSSNDRKLKSVSSIVEQINSLESQMQKLSDQEIGEKTTELKSRFRTGETLDQLLSLIHI